MCEREMEMDHTSRTSIPIRLFCKNNLKRAPCVFLTVGIGAVGVKESLLL